MFPPPPVGRQVKCCLIKPGGGDGSGSSGGEILAVTQCMKEPGAGAAADTQLWERHKQLLELQLKQMEDIKEPDMTTQDLDKAVQEHMAAVAVAAREQQEQEQEWEV